MSYARRTRELSAYGNEVHSCNLPYRKTFRVRATFGKVLFIRAKTLSKVARTCTGGFYVTGKLHE